MQTAKNVSSVPEHQRESGGRPPFPDRLKPLRLLMPELLALLESGLEDQLYAFVWLEESRSLSVTAARVESLTDSVDRGMVMRIFARGGNFEEATNILDPDHLRRLARGLRERVVSALSGMTSTDPVYRPLSIEEEIRRGLPGEVMAQMPAASDSSTWLHFAPVCLADPDRTDHAILGDRAREYRGRMMSISAVQNAALADARVFVRQTVKTQVFVDRTRNLSQILPVSLAYAMAISSGGHMGRSIRGGLGGLDIAVLDDAALLEATETCLRLDQAERLKPGRYRIITGPDVTGVIAHEAFGHTQEGDTCAKGRSIATGLRSSGHVVGNASATIHNNAAIFSMGADGERAGNGMGETGTMRSSVLSYGTNGSYFFDHEGEFARLHSLIDGGLLNRPMTDLWSSVRLGEIRTANGKRESWRRPIMTRQTNTYFTPGDSTLHELIVRVKHGYLARHAHGGMEDPKGGSLTAGTEYLEEIENGRLTGRLFLGPSGGHVELSDPVFDMLARIEGKTSVEHPEGIPANKYGGCGKYHKELVEAGSGGPYILWESINCG